MKRVENRNVRSYKGPLLWPTVLGDVEIEHCSFTACSIGHRHSKDFSRRTIVRNVAIKNCTVESNTILGPAQFEDVLLENITGCEVFVLGALYKHVKMKGAFDSVILLGLPNLQTLPSDRPDYWSICDKYYVDHDWALDISEAEFMYIDVRARGIPASLIVRDLETQALIKQANLENRLWHGLPIGVGVESQLKSWETGGGEDLIIIAPKRNKKLFAEVMADIKLLRAEGIAEPD